MRIPFKLTYLAVCLTGTPIISDLFITSHSTMYTPIHLTKKKKEKPLLFYLSLTYLRPLLDQFINDLL